MCGIMHRSALSAAKLCTLPSAVMATRVKTETKLVSSSSGTTVFRLEERPPLFCKIEMQNLRSAGKASFVSRIALL